MHNYCYVYENVEFFTGWKFLALLHTLISLFLITNFLNFFSHSYSRRQKIYNKKILRIFLRLLKILYPPSWNRVLDIEC